MQKKKTAPLKNKKKSTEVLPLIPLRDLVLFPEFTVSLFIGRRQSKNAVKNAMKGDRKIFLSTQKDSILANPSEKDVHSIGVRAEILQMLKLPDGTLKILVEVLDRVKWLKKVSPKSAKAPPEKDTVREPKVEEVKENTKNKDSFPKVMNSSSEKLSVKFFDLDNNNKSQAGEGGKEHDGLFISLVVEPLETIEDTIGIPSLIKKLNQQFVKYAKANPEISSETLREISKTEKASKLADMIAGRLNLSAPQKQNILSEININRRLELVINAVLTLLSLQDIDKQIQKNVQERISKSQKDYYLGEKIKEIRKELGHDQDIYEEAQELRNRLKEKDLPEEAKAKVLKEISKLERTPPLSAEVTVLRNYIDWMLDIPWKEESRDNTDIEHAQEILDRDHYGLEEVKDRILDFIVVRRFVKKLKGPILCFVGPPGVGKTSLAKSIADSLERQFIRVSLGGIKDEAEIRGHRKTYVGAMPGRIIQSMKKSKTRNPVFLLDEVDKLSSDFRGDPASALLEVLDPEQNWSFQDHYLEVPYDLSGVLFIGTANALHRIPPPLRDRMEVINIGGYSEFEKLKIGRNFLLPKALKQNGLNVEQLKISNAHLYYIIRHYTREAGVRTLDRILNKIARKSLREISRKIDKQEKSKRRQVSEKDINELLKKGFLEFKRENIKEFLGKEQYRFGLVNPTNEIGFCNGLAWTEMGGEMLAVEVVLTSGKGGLQITGNLGEVMKESVKAAMTFLRSIGGQLKISDSVIRKNDVHVHVPEGAIPKDGPSAGITVATTLVSAFTKIPIKSELAMTGEITLRGQVLPVGGIKEKVLAAHRGLIRELIFPLENKKDLVDIPEYVKKRMKFHFVSTMKEVLPLALVTAGSEDMAEFGKLISGESTRGEDISKDIIQ